MFESIDSSGMQAPTFRLPLDIQETKDGYVIKAPIAGFKPEEVEVTFSDGVLSIKATHKEEKSQKEGNYVRRELMYGNYQRQIAMPPDVQGDSIKASFDNGVLQVEVPRKAKPQPKRIEVRSSHKEGAKENDKQLVGSGTAKS
jgi:HSP20 family protein